MKSRPGQFSTLMRTLGRQVKDRLSSSLSFDFKLPPPPSRRVAVVEKVSRNALAELVGRAKSYPQRGDTFSPNPAYVALARLTEESGRPGLALSLRHESGEITFLDFGPTADKLEDSEAVYVERLENLALWRRLERLIRWQVDKSMVGPPKPIRPPEEVDL